MEDVGWKCGRSGYRKRKWIADAQEDESVGVTVIVWGCYSTDSRTTLSSEANQQTWIHPLHDPLNILLCHVATFAKSIRAGLVRWIRVGSLYHNQQ